MSLNPRTDKLKSLPGRPKKGRGSADSAPNMVIPPDVRAEADRKALLVANVGSTVNRAGAGGTKAGLVGIRPRGLSQSNKFHELFTESPDKKKEDIRKDVWLKDSELTKNEHVTPFAAITGSWCPGCQKRIGMSGRVKDLQAVFLPIMPNENGARWAAMSGLKIGDVVGTIMCPRCFREVERLK